MTSHARPQDRNDDEDSSPNVSMTDLNGFISELGDIEGNILGQSSTTPTESNIDGTIRNDFFFGEEIPHSHQQRVEIP